MYENNSDFIRLVTCLVPTIACFFSGILIIFGSTKDYIGSDIKAEDEFAEHD